MTDTTYTQNQRVLIFGAGIAGITAALELARFNIKVTLAEKAPFIGGHAANLTCKAADECVKCNGCLVEERLREFSENGHIEVLLNSSIRSIRKHGKTFRVDLISGPQWIDPHKCNGCGLCYENCPDQDKGAILRAPSHHIRPPYAVNPGLCSCLTRGDEIICGSVCPEGAIDRSLIPKSRELEAEGLIIATGFEPFDPSGIARFGYQKFSNMVTGMELERMLRFRGDVSRPSDGRLPGKIAFVQCVGSRDPHLGRDYCSRVCCGYALRTALRITHTHPGTQITLFYMDIQNFGKDFDRYYRRVKDRVRLIRGLPGDFEAAENECISICYYDEASGKSVSEPFDLVALSVGMSPSPSNLIFGDLLGLAADRDGFLRLPAELRDLGIGIAGSSEGPMDVAESISHAKRAALEMLQYLRKGLSS